MNIWSEDSLFGQIFGFLGDMILLNILWIVMSLPIVTIGVSTTATYYVALKLHKEGHVSVLKSFFKSFRESFFQATIVWLFLAAIAVVLYIEGKWLLITGNSSSLLLSYALLAIGLGAAILFLYSFPVIAAFRNTLGNLMGHAFYFAFHNIIYLIVTAALTFLPMYFTMVDTQLFPVYLLVWLMVGFALTAYINSWFYLRLFRPYLGIDVQKE